MVTEDIESWSGGGVFQGIPFGVDLLVHFLILVRFWGVGAFFLLCRLSYRWDRVLGWYYFHGILLDLLSLSVFLVLVQFPRGW